MVQMGEKLETKKDVLLIGIGSTGMKTLLDMMSRKRSEIQCLAVDTEWEILKEYGIWKRLLLGKNTTYGYPALSIEEAIMATMEEEKVLRCIFKKYNKIFVAFEIPKNNLTTIGILHVLGKIAREENVSITGLFFQLEEENGDTVEIVKEYMDEVVLLCDEEHTTTNSSLDKESSSFNYQELCDCFTWAMNEVLKVDKLIHKANDIMEKCLY